MDFGVVCSVGGAGIFLKVFRPGIFLEVFLDMAWQGCVVFFGPWAHWEYMVIAKIFKRGRSVFAEMLPGRREKTRERMNDIQLISKDLHDARLERDIRKVLQARGLRGAVVTAGAAMFGGDAFVVFGEWLVAWG